jgi:hypothetical protein
MIAHVFSFSLFLPSVYLPGRLHRFYHDCRRIATSVAGAKTQSAGCATSKKLYFIKDLWYKLTGY